MEPPAEDLVLAEQMRQRDVLVQVERFLKYAAKGTDPDVVRREAASWAARLATFRGANEAKAQQLVKRLRALTG